MFRFRLEKVLDYRKRTEEDRQRKLAKSLNILDKDEKRLGSLHERHQRYQDDFNTVRSKGIWASMALVYTNFFTRSSNEIEQQGERVLKSRIEANKKRVSLIEATKEKKVLEKLRERKFDEYQEEETRLEERIIDDTATNAYAREI